MKNLAGRKSRKIVYKNGAEGGGWNIVQLQTAINVKIIEREEFAVTCRIRASPIEINVF